MDRVRIKPQVDDREWYLWLRL